MNVPDHVACRHFVTYSGVRLPVRMVNPLEDEDLGHRNTYIRAWFDAADRLLGWDKLVYGDVQISHRYHYHDNGALCRAEILMDEEETVMTFDVAGAPAVV